MKKRLPKLKALLLFVFAFLSGMQAFAQRQVTGKVTDASSGDPLIGATIQIKGTTRGTVTDLSGNYTINVDNGQDVLVFSYVGYDSKEETVGDRSTIDITLSEQATQLQDVVVIGYGTVKKSDLTGSVAVVYFGRSEPHTCRNLFKSASGQGSRCDRLQYLRTSRVQDLPSMSAASVQSPRLQTRSMLSMGSSRVTSMSSTHPILKAFRSSRTLQQQLSMVPTVQTVL